jgi:SAM-dependent methyltransferase
MSRREGLTARFIKSKNNLMTESGKTNRRPCRVCDSHDFTPIYYLDGQEIVLCQRCGLIQVSASLRLDDLKRIYETIGQDETTPVSGFLKKRIHRASRFRLRYFEKYTGLTSGSILEVGSGRGHFLSLLKERGFQVLGVEPSLKGALQHRERGIPVINDILENADLPDAHFDAACLFQVFEHFEDPKQAAVKLHAKLKKGGYLVLEVPDIFSTGSKFEKYSHRLFNARVHLSYFSAASLDALLQPLGFARVVARHTDYEPLRIPFGKSLKKIFVPLVNPHFKGPLQKILQKEIEIHYRSGGHQAGKADGRRAPTPGRLRLKTVRKALTAPLDVLFGYLAYRLDRGSNLFWIGKKV